MFKKLSIITLSLTIVFLSACSGGRDISSVESAIIGHWVSETEDPEYEDTHYYISKDKFIMIDQGTKSISDYKISTTNEKEKWIEIEIEGRKNIGALVRKLEFTNEDMTEINTPLNLDNVILSSDRADSEQTQALHDLAKILLEDKEFESTWKYVDDLTEPKE